MKMIKRTSYKHGRYVKKNCLNCKKKIDVGSKSGLCRLCLNKQKREKSQVYCLDCNKKITRYHKRCNRCNNKKYFSGKNNPMYGRTHSIEVKNKLRKLRLNTKLSEQTKTKIGNSQKGKKHWNYIDGRSFEKYPQNFNDKLRNKIRKRDNYQCQNKDCNMTQEEHFIVYGRDIEIHHIDYNKQNCNENNLITLCKQCNVRANYNREYWKTKFINVTQVKEK